jgi:CBS domain-containing protein
MKAKDVMTTRVVTVGPETTVREVAELLLRHRISAVPVLDGDSRLAGIVSEGDLIRRVETGTAERHRSWWLRIFEDREILAAEYVKSHATKVSDIMTKPVITVDDEADLAHIATVLERNRIKRVPVMRGDRLVGIVSRANLLQGIAAAKPVMTPATADDSNIRAQVLAAIESQPWFGQGAMNVTVTDGVVEMWGVYDSTAERDAGRIAAEAVPGVRRIDDHRVRMVVANNYV